MRFEDKPAAVPVEASHEAISNTPQSERFIELRNVSLVYGEGSQQTMAVDRLSIAMNKGEFVSVVGPSGCGKSTLMKLVSGLQAPTTGAVLVRSQSVHEPVAGVGMAFQNPLLMPWRTALANVILPLEILSLPPGRSREVKRQRTAKALKLLSSVGLDGFAAKFPWQLSGGMQQRVNLCRAIIHEPEILLLDEPFGALDTFTREDLWLAMQKLWIEQEFTALLVTHDLQEAAFLADRIYVMSGRPGRVVREHKIEHPRPRNLDLLADPSFALTVAELRHAVSQARHL